MGICCWQVLITIRRRNCMSVWLRNFRNIKIPGFTVFYHYRSYRISSKHSEEKSGSAEFLSGFYREDRLIPIITVVVYFGADSWDAPKSFMRCWLHRTKAYCHWFLIIGVKAIWFILLCLHTKRTIRRGWKIMLRGFDKRCIGSK